MYAAARAYTNIALIKYWGKKDEQLILPMNSSLSLTLDAFYTETSVEPLQGLHEDEVIMAGAPLSGAPAAKSVVLWTLFVKNREITCLLEL